MIEIVKCFNSSVTDEYLRIIGASFEKCGENVEFLDSVKALKMKSRQNIVVVARLLDFLKVYLMGFSKIVIWFQGVEPEESFLIHNSRIRWMALSALEYLALKKSIFHFFVSSEMKEHYETKYHMEFADNVFYCMPCLNTQIHKNVFFENRNKYKNNSFCYVGSLAKWQCFDEIIDLYKIIKEKYIPDADLIVYTPDIEEAQLILEEKKVINCKVCFVENNSLPNKLADMKYGFIIREDNTVNRVATPTKISTYLSCGVIPIYSECLKDFSTEAKRMKYVLSYDDSFAQKLNSIQNSTVEPDDVYKEYQQVFDTYYNSTYHLERIAPKLFSIVQ